MAEIIGAHHSAFHVADLERSLAFYSDLLGFEIVWRRVNDSDYVREIVGYPTAEIHQALLRIPGSSHHLELMDYRGAVDRKPVDTSPANPGTSHICLMVRGLRELHRTLVDANVKFVSDPVHVTSGVNTGRLCVYMLDPDGFPIELLSDTPEAEL